MPILGAHMSVSGGFHLAVERAKAVGCDCVQVFTGNPNQWPFVSLPPAKAGNKVVQYEVSDTKNNNQWAAKPISDAEAAQFKAAIAATGVGHPTSHDSYLINLASPDDALWKKSIDAFVVELERAERLGIAGVVAHPGACLSSSEEEGLARIAAALDEVHRRTPNVKARCLLETTAGQGSCLGHRFEHLAAIIAGVKKPERLGVCVDTCHVFAAGYPLAPKKDYMATIRALDDAVGLDRVAAIHLNDSKRELGSRVDRHEHIGRGKLGLEPFRLLLNDKRFRSVPMFLETAKGEEDGEDLDAINLRTLRSLVTSGRGVRR